MRLTALLGMLAAAAAVTAAPTGNTLNSTLVERATCKSITLGWNIKPIFDFPTNSNDKLEMQFKLNIGGIYFGETKQFTYAKHGNSPSSETHKSTDGKFKVKHGHPDYSQVVTLEYKGKKHKYSNYAAKVGDDIMGYSYDYWDCIEY
ncbi:hypothetical protein BGZ95_004784 [Linnemannia exigua]|uniref:Uncharacterized protein n=1 Tax=Linnemannia exigua TaxID=604196 RepID=A0AAD4H8X9_9FUNG|nr:hypothetical protein BGZ95_004784 [Linnemannia exigua]